MGTGWWPGRGQALCITLWGPGWGSGCSEWGAWGKSCFLWPRAGEAEQSAGGSPCCHGGGPAPEWCLVRWFDSGTGQALAGWGSPLLGTHGGVQRG